MNQHQSPSTEELVLNPSFRRWILNNNEEDGQYWKFWEEEHPEYQSVVNEAKVLLSVLKHNNQALSVMQIDAEADKIMALIQTDRITVSETSAVTENKVVAIYNKWWFKVAATLVVVMGIALFFRLQQADKTDLYKTFAISDKEDFTDFSNNTGHMASVRLPDGSYVNLANGSCIGFSKRFSAEKRVVYLIGEGFFQVSKNPAKPFIVYTSRLITKVLGTSFFVNSNQESEKTSVVVKTGKVSVFKRENFKKSNEAADLTTGVILTPNQAAVLNSKHDLNKQIVANPIVINRKENGLFVFDSTPISKVFKKMQSTYGIRIIYDEEVLSDCSLSARMGNENFYEKLSLICHAINASYETIDGDIVITATNGCAN